VFPLGSWKSIKEMEDDLTLEELYLLVDGMHRTEHRRNKFMAALNGVDLDEGAKNADFEKVKQRADAALAGRTEEQQIFDIIGIEIEDDDD
jgi:hypothetical protein